MNKPSYVWGYSIIPVSKYNTVLISANTDQMKCVSSPWKVTNKRSAARNVLSILSMSNLIGYLISTFELYFSHLLFKIVDANSNVQTYALLHYGLLEF